MGSLMITLSIANATVSQAIGIKEAIAMDVEKYGDVRVLSVDVKEDEQLTIPSAAPRERAQRSKPATANQLDMPADKPCQPAPSPRRSETAFCYCKTCANYEEKAGRDDAGKLYWGLCRRHGKPVYDLGKGCRSWKDKTELMEEPTEE